MAASIDDCLKQLIAFNDQLRAQHAALANLQNKMSVLMVQVKAHIGKSAEASHNSGMDASFPSATSTGSFGGGYAFRLGGSTRPSAGSVHVPRPLVGPGGVVRRPSILDSEAPSLRPRRASHDADFTAVPMDEAVEWAISTQSIGSLAHIPADRPGGLIPSLSAVSIRGLSSMLRSMTTDRMDRPLMASRSGTPTTGVGFWTTMPRQGNATQTAAMKDKDLDVEALVPRISAQNADDSLESLEEAPGKGYPAARRALSTIPRSVSVDLGDGPDIEPDEENSIGIPARRDQTLVAHKSRASEKALAVAPPPVEPGPPVAGPPPPNPAAPPLKQHPIWKQLYIVLCAAPRYNEFRTKLPQTEYEGAIKQVHVQNPSLLLHRRSVAFVFWEVVMSVLYLISIFVLPIGVSFTSAHLDMLPFSTVLITFFGIDTLIQFFTLGTRDGVAMPLRELIASYMTYNFWLDIVTVFPFYQVLQGYEIPNLHCVLLIPLLRLRRLFPIISNNPLYGNISIWVQTVSGLGGSFMSVWLFGGLLLVYLHTYACGMFLMGQLTNWQSWQSSDLQAVLQRSPGNQYTYAFFQAIGNTFPITGFRPVTAYEQWCAIISCLIGALLYASLVGTISSFSFGLDSSGRLYKEKMDEVNEYMLYKNLNTQLKTKVRNYFQLKYRGKYFDETVIMKELNDSLREEITVHNCRDLIAKVNFLSRNVGDGRDHNFLGRIARALRAVYYVQGDTIFEQGRVGTEMYFILSGTVEIIVAGNRVACLSDGAFFGEVALLGDVPRTATIKAAADTVAYRLERPDLQSILADYDDMAMKIRLVYEERMLKVHQEKKAKELKEAEEKERAAQSGPLLLTEKT
ncbi:anaphase-promoting complex subunit Hcn1 [Geranomyces variabilis]|uniref:Anaphase-promoting complex subunit Hcn1 n=1 Tax=Geranomyces variabilis TaxID=109894 RepID=A0AAD5TFK6_9FUNG|nr:anaphase-promoting complex subunit Hcn1 [Geranomyces variabilis]